MTSLQGRKKGEVVEEDFHVLTWDQWEEIGGQRCFPLNENMVRNDLGRRNRMSSTWITQQIYYHCIHSLGKPSVMTETDEREEQNLWEQENKTMKNRGGVEQVDLLPFCDTLYIPNTEDSSFFIVIIIEKGFRKLKILLEVFFYRFIHAKWLLRVIIVQCFKSHSEEVKTHQCNSKTKKNG